MPSSPSSKRAPSISWRLREAAALGNVARVLEEVEKGVDVNEGGASKRTALHKAAQRGHGEVVRQLLGSGADPDVAASTTQDTALHLAAVSGHTDVVSELVKHGANIQAANKLGWTPLHGAMYSDHLDVARVLCRAGADPTQCNSTGLSPNMMTLRCEQHQVEAITEAAKFQRETQMDLGAEEGLGIDKPSYQDIRRKRLAAAMERKASREAEREAELRALEQRAVERRTARSERDQELRFALTSTLQLSKDILDSGIDYLDLDVSDAPDMIERRGRMQIVGHSPNSRRKKSQQDRQRDRKMALRSALQAKAAKEIAQNKLDGAALEAIRQRETAEAEAEEAKQRAADEAAAEAASQVECKAATAAEAGTGTEVEAQTDAEAKATAAAPAPVLAPALEQPAPEPEKEEQAQHEEALAAPAPEVNKTATAQPSSPGTTERAAAAPPPAKKSAVPPPKMKGGKPSGPPPRVSDMAVPLALCSGPMGLERGTRSLAIADAAAQKGPGGPPPKKKPGPPGPGRKT